MKPITIFSWGYYGWGNSTKKFIKAVDAVEASRGFAPPLFVDTRIRRAGRAEGFKSDRFERLLGPDRHRWMKSLGNEAIITNTKQAIQIADPDAAHELLYRAMDAAEQHRRLVYFCGCHRPRHCHRSVISRLVLKVAAKRGIPIQIVEWPGGKARHIETPVTQELFRSLVNGRMSIPLAKRPDLAEVAALPWGTTVTIHSRNESLHRVVGPAAFERDAWHLPVDFLWYDPGVPLAEYKREAARIRKRFGYEPQYSS